MIYGYVRVSTTDQCLDRQTDALNNYKQLDRLFADKESGKNFDRAGYQQMKSIVKENDEIIIKELDRLGRNKEQVKQELEWFKQHKVTVRILNVPTTLIEFNGQEWIRDMVNNILIEVMGTIAEQERIKIKQRQAEGIAAKKARGDWDDYGRPKKQPQDFEKFLKMQKDGLITVDEAVSQLGISRRTWYNRVRQAG